MKENKFKFIILLSAIFLISLNATAGLPEDTAKYFSIKNISEEQVKMSIPDFIYEKDGISYNFTDNKGKIILINLWATWCGPCKHEIPDLMKLYDEFNDNNFEIMGILVADKKENLDNYLNSNQINYPIINGNDKLVSAISKAIGNQINSIPFTIIVDRDGQVLETFIGSRTYEEFRTIIIKYLN